MYIPWKCDFRVLLEVSSNTSDHKLTILMQNISELEHGNVIHDNVQRVNTEYGDFVVVVYQQASI